MHGVAGVLEAYRSVFKSDLTMSGPTVFDQVLQAAAARAHRYQVSHRHKKPGILLLSVVVVVLANSNIYFIIQQNPADKLQYCILLVITDGIMDHTEETRRKLDVYSSVPLSVIFVGVGRSDFQSMYQLCDSSCNRKITTFVEFRKHQHSATSLGRAALEYIPNQVVEYMVNAGINP